MHIRTEQIDALDRAAELRFEDELLEHLRGFAPELHEIHGDDVFRRVIEDGVERAAGHGFTTRGPVRFFVECLFAYGAAFDADVQIPGLADAFGALDAEAGMTPDEQQRRADELFERTERYRLAAFGAEGELACAALERFQGFMDRSRRFDKATFEDEFVRALTDVHPEKVSLVGPAAMQDLARRAAETAPTVGLTDVAGSALLGGLMFAFGQGVVDDPLYPWVSAVPMGDGADPVGALRRKTTTYLTAALQSLAP